MSGPSGEAEPSSYCADTALRDGSKVQIRALRPDDAPRLVEGFKQLSAETIYRRFFQAKQELTPAELDYLTRLDFRNHVALCAVIPGEGGPQLVGVGRFVRNNQLPTQAEVAFVVGDEYQGRGIATLLLTHLCILAARLEIRTLQAVVLPENREMLEVFEHSGRETSRRFRDGSLEVLLATGPIAS